MLRALVPEQEWDGAFAGETSATGTWSTSRATKLWFAPASDIWELCWASWRQRLGTAGHSPK